MNYDYEVGDIIDVTEIEDLDKFFDKYEARWIAVGIVEISRIK